MPMIVDIKFGNPIIALFFNIKLQIIYIYFYFKELIFNINFHNIFVKNTCFKLINNYQYFVFIIYVINIIFL